MFIQSVGCNQQFYCLFVVFSRHKYGKWKVKKSHFNFKKKVLDHDKYFNKNCVYLDSEN